MSLTEEETLRWLVRVVVEVGVADLALRLIDGFRSRYPASRDDFSLLRDEARAHFLLDHTPDELRTCKQVYRSALKRAPSALEAADVWINYHEPCRLEIKYGAGRLQKVAAVAGMLGALVRACWKTIWRRGSEVARLRGYVWLRCAQVLENLVRQSRLAGYPWLRVCGDAVTRWFLSRAGHHFVANDNYYGTLQTQRILLRVSSASPPEQLRAARSMRDYYCRLGYLTGWSNSNRDVIDVMRKDHLDVDEARRLAREAIEVSKLAGDRPGLAKATELLADLG